MMRVSTATLVLLFLLLSITLFSYWPGVGGLFIFDDIPNISPMGNHPNLSGWDNFKLFILEGNSGPTGRPISLASFYLNDNTWPSQPSSFTLTNILIHLLNGLLVFWFTHKLAETIRLTKIQQVSFSILSTALWVLHPLHTTTVLYIVQRMTELSALFTLLGLIFYLYGREKLFNKSVAGLLHLFFGVGISLILSILSKENGILLVAYILVIEFFLLQPLKRVPPQRFYYWFIPAIVFPFLIILIYLAMRVVQGGGFEIRDFTLTERLLTESRIIFDYIGLILLPSVGDSGIFHDDYVISRSLFQPWTTLVSLLGIGILIVLAFILRKKHPLITFSIAWFFAGHILESTVISLELYFEHRNYLPMLGFLIAISWYASKYLSKFKIPIVAFFSITITLLAFLVMQNSILWSKPVELSINWYKSHPNSTRAQEAYLNFMKPLDVTEKDLTIEQLKIRNKSPYTSLLALKQACQVNNISSNMFENSLQILQSNAIHVSTSTALKDFILAWLEGTCDNISSKQIEYFLTNISSLKNTKKVKSFDHHVHYWLAEVYRKKKDFNNTMVNLEKAYQLDPNVNLLLIQAATLSSAGLYEKAIAVLDNTSLLEGGIRKKLALEIRQKEINQLKKSIISNMKREKKGTLPLKRKRGRYPLTDLP